MKNIILCALFLLFTSCGKSNMGLSTSFASPRTADMAFSTSSSYASESKNAPVVTDTSRIAEEDTKEAPLSQSKKIPENEIQSGSLTAGSFDDNAYPKVFQKFINDTDRNLQKPLFEWGQHIIIHVKNELGEPIGNAWLKIYNASSQELVMTVPTGSNGKVAFVAGWDTRGVSDFRVDVKTLDGKNTTAHFSLATPQWEIVIPGALYELPRQLDLAFVIDATGSMQDEIDYIKVETSYIAKAVKESFPYVDTKLALIVYRDLGDEYVTRKYDFQSLASFNTTISKEFAGGGGDYPEAMDKALEDATELSWRSQNTARILFLIADAPPHDEHMEVTIKHVNALRFSGVKIYPIAASGVAEKAEYIMRIGSFLTLAEYIFLTDDSGIGNSHAEPHIPFYHVQKLSVLMARMISSELAGEKFLPHKDQILRTSGNPNFAKY